MSWRRVFQNVNRLPFAAFAAAPPRPDEHWPFVIKLGDGQRIRILASALSLVHRR